MKLRGRTDLERQILQAAVDGKTADFFEAIQKDSEEPNDKNLSHTCWWLRIFDVTHGCGVMHWAAGMGHLSLVKYFLVTTTASGSNNGDNSPFSLVDQPAQGNSQGRTPLHYACRNGHFEIARYLVEEHGANVNPLEAHHGVSPFQLAVWRNHLEICQWLVNDCNVDPGQSNAFGCTAIHWLGLVPKPCLSHGDILDLAKWLGKLVDVFAKQNQGHSVLHKAAWGGHLHLCQYFHEEYGMYDDSPDEAGNYAADLADMGGHDSVAQYLRAQCSPHTIESVKVLRLESISQRYDRQAIKRAYHKAARELHPDRILNTNSCENKEGSKESTNTAMTESRLAEFTKLTKAYRHLMDENGDGSQCNPKHKLPLLLTATAAETTIHDTSIAVNGSPSSLDTPDSSDRFAAQLTAVVTEYNNKGLDISNLRKKWKQLWPENEFPAGKTKSLKTWLERNASHIVSLEKDERGIFRIFAKYPTTTKTARHAV